MAKKPAGAGVYLCTPAHGSGACRALPRARASSRRGRTAPLADGGAVDDLPRSRSYGCARTEITWDFRPPPSGEPDTTAYKRSAVNVEYRQLFIHRRISMRRPLAPAWDRRRFKTWPCPALSAIRDLVKPRLGGLNEGACFHHSLTCAATRKAALGRTRNRHRCARKFDSVLRLRGRSPHEGADLEEADGRSSLPRSGG